MTDINIFKSLTDLYLPWTQEVLKRGRCLKFDIIMNLFKMIFEVKQ